MKPYELLEHTADIGVRAWGQNPAELYQHAAQGLYAVALTAPPAHGEESWTIKLRADTLPDLLIGFLEELIYFLYTRRLAACAWAFKEMTENTVHVVCACKRLASGDFRTEVKSPTYHNLKVEEQGGGWMAEIYFDV
ncbi:archease [candidate division FCPU426 bacterium]|nr:archease [candidate division FCPU426 bacterium]